MDLEAKSPSLIRRWAVGLEYLGSGFRGWQAQASAVPSVQAAFESAIGEVAAHRIQLQGAGRTDAGVHAFGQVGHFDSSAARSAYAWSLGSNRLLPGDLSLRWVREVPGNFHARHEAIARNYRYVIHNQRERSAWLGGRTTWVPRPLDAASMHRAAQRLVGSHDFSAFRASECQSATPVRSLMSISVRRVGSCLVLDMRANAFLHHMVRNITGSLIEIGLERRLEQWMTELLEGRDRRLAAATAPAEGLYFVGPEYDASWALPPPPSPWFPAACDLD
jgi:tRNA pseudouridine38-40 synthase